jgi:hypothetical protein
MSTSPRPWARPAEPHASLPTPTRSNSLCCRPPMSRRALPSARCALPGLSSSNWPPTVLLAPARSRRHLCVLGPQSHPVCRRHPLTCEEVDEHHWPAQFAPARSHCRPVLLALHTPAWSQPAPALYIICRTTPLIFRTDLSGQFAALDKNREDYRRTPEFGFFGLPPRRRQDALLLPGILAAPVTAWVRLIHQGVIRCPRHQDRR